MPKASFLSSERKFKLVSIPGGYFHIRRSEGGGGGLGPDIKFRGKIWARSSQVHQIRGKTWELLLLQDAKVGEKSQCWGQI